MAFLVSACFNCKGATFMRQQVRPLIWPFLCRLLQGPVVCVPKVGPLLKLLNAYAFIRLLSPHMCPRAGPLMRLFS